MSQASIQRRRFVENCISVKKVLDFNDWNHYVWGVDISLGNTGLTIYDTRDNTCESMSHKMKEGSRYTRMFKLQQDFAGYVEEYTPRLVVIEGWAYGKSMYREVLGEVTYAIKSAFLSKCQNSGLGIPVLIVTPLSLKKFAVGICRNVPKKAIVNEVRNSWGIPVKNHDEADSVVLCMLGRSVLKFVSTCDDSILDLDDKGIKKFMDNTHGFSKTKWECIASVIANDGAEIDRFFLK